MKKYNIEQQLAEKLGQQSITPSADAWERIAHNRRQQKTGKKKPFGYYAAAVAACLILGGGLFFMKDDSSTLPVAEPVVVHAEKAGNTPPNTLPRKQPTEVIEAVAISETVSVSTKKGQVAKQEIPMEKAAELALPKAGVQINSGDLTPAVAVITQPLPLSKENEAEQLLANAYKKIGVQKQLAQPTNDTALLKEVEAEMNDYYRDKAMRFFALKHKTIRFAVRDKE
jgi:hypothetical protein